MAALSAEDEQKNQVAMQCRTPGSAKREAYALAEHLVVVREKKDQRSHISTGSFLRMMFFYSVHCRSKVPKH